MSDEETVMPEAMSNSRAARKARGECPYCGDTPDPGRLSCERCLAAHRQRNRKWDDTTHRERTGRRTSEQVRADFSQRNADDEALLIRWAEEHGRVPSVSQASSIIGRASHILDQHSQHRRRAAFGLRLLTKRETGSKVIKAGIPYPVPAEYLADTGAI